MIKGRKIVLGITGSIAAYKAVEVMRELQKRGALVKVALTPSAKEFISTLALEVLSGSKVYSEVVPRSSEKIEHTELSSWGELLLIAPATANTVAKIACGIADTPVCELALCMGKGIIAPAMNSRMYENPITQENLKKLSSLGWEIVEPAVGELACGEYGKGKLAPVEDIVDAATYWFYPKLLNGKKVVITAGPTREYIDPVRFISNPSSGKMGFALAKVAAAMGGEVVLITGKSCLRTPYKVMRIDVETVEEMREAVLREVEDAALFISAAAVGDYRPKEPFKEKIKKKEGELSLTFVRTPDILREVAGKRSKGLVVVGFAAETNNLKGNALKKLKEKGLDLIVANDVKKGVFGISETEVLILGRAFEKEVKGGKEEVAYAILKEAAKLLA